jgi:hypothetical protein
MAETYHFSSEQLIRTCPLPKSMFSHKSRESLTITASRIEPLSSLLKRNKKHLPYSIMEILIESIGRQLHQLEMENKAISSFNLDDITVFYANDTSSSIHFAITNEDKIHEIDDGHQLTISAPYQKEYTTPTTKNIAFHSPEFKEFISKKTIPYTLHFKSGYYSFGLLCVYCYVSRNKDPTEKELAPIINTKIYWFLRWALHENPSERRYICV